MATILLVESDDEQAKAQIQNYAACGSRIEQVANKESALARLQEDHSIEDVVIDGVLYKRDGALSELGEFIY